MVNYSVSHGNSGEVCTCVCMCVFICTSMMILFWLCHSVTHRSVLKSRSHIVLRTLSTIIQPHSSVTANDILCLRMLNYILDNIFLYSFMYSIFFLHSCLSLYHSTKRLTFFSHMTLFRAK